MQKGFLSGRLIDGVRVIGNDICDLYFNSKGLYDIEIKFYDYEKTGELDMLTLDDAVAKVKEPVHLFWYRKRTGIFRRGGKADHRADKAAVRQPVFRWLRNSPAGI